MLKRQQFIYKFSSDYLRFREWDVGFLDFKVALSSGMIVAVSDTQIFKTLREMSGREWNLDGDEIEALYLARDGAKGKERRRVQEEIWARLYLPEYVTVVMDSDGDYEHLHKQGFVLNGRRFVEFNSSSSQARVRTVVFLAEDVYGGVVERLNAGRRDDEMVPAKYSAYLGLACSSIDEVKWPRIAIVKDWEQVVPTEVDYVVETGPNTDDKIERRVEDITFSRFDGSGLVRPEIAQLWATELELDYLPAQFCIRTAFTKGMLSVFNWDEWLGDVKHGGIIEDVYGHSVDLRKVDVILTASQVKLWDAWDSSEHFKQSCLKHGLVFGISLWTPKEDKEHLILNYQFIQTLKLTDEDIKELTHDSVNYISRVSVEDVDYTKLFLLGEHQSQDSMEAFLRTGDDYWLKSLVVEPSLMNDKYTKQRIRETLIKRIEQAACGKIMVPGNFQVIVPDPVAFMEAICGLPVVGLLKSGQAYSNFWDEKQIDTVDSMRSPLTNYSEHYVLNIVSKYTSSFLARKIRKYYRYAYTGIIVNCHDDHTLRWSGSDYDYDIIATTSSPVILKGIYQGLVPIVGKPMKGKKVKVNRENRYQANLLTFGSKIGRLTNLASAMCCLRADFEEGSQEYELINDRLKACCKHQSNQIDRAKAGVEIKDIPKIWTRYKKINEEETDSTDENIDLKSQELKKAEIEQQRLYNKCLVDKHPYFFKYIYSSDKIRYNKYYTAKDKVSRLKFDMPLKELLFKYNNGEVLTEEQLKFSGVFYAFNGFINSKSEMNRLCLHIESVDFEIRKRISDQSNFDYSMFLNYNGFDFDQKIYKQVCDAVSAYVKTRATVACDNYYNFNIEEVESFLDINTEKIVLKDNLYSICPNVLDLTNYLVRFFYEVKTSFSKSLLWEVCGKQMYKNLLRERAITTVPVRDDEGDIIFMYKRYKNKEVIIPRGQNLQ